MFFLAGIQSKIKDLGRLPSGTCPVCGRTGALHLCNKYMTPHVFFIPTFRFHNSYPVTCGACASLLELSPEKGKAVERGQPVEILPGDLQVVQDNQVPVCPRCGGRLQRGSAFCNHCGERL